MTAPGRPIRVATYNIHAGVGTDRRYAPDRVVRVLAELDADVVALQEVSSRPQITGQSDQFLYFEQATGMQAVAGANVISGDARYGNVLLSRLPIVEQVLEDISVPPFERRGAIVADLAVGDRKLRVITTHLGLRRRERRHQFGRLCGLIEAARTDDAPVLVMGDFNSWWPDLPALRRAGARSGRRFAPASFPTLAPVLALDRIWGIPHGLVRTTQTHYSDCVRLTSDHRPVVAELSLQI